jgi:hypothetical protein
MLEDAHKELILEDVLEICALWERNTPELDTLTLDNTYSTTREDITETAPRRLTRHIVP